MRLTCTVRVNFRPLPNTTGQITKGLARASMLSIGKRTGSNRELQMRLVSGQCKTGNWYKVGDIEMIFSRFVHEGKATIRFRQPRHDLIVQADPGDLKKFLQTLEQWYKHGSDAKVEGSQLSNLDAEVPLKQMPKRVCINQPENYPVLEGFPSSIQQLDISGLARRSFDRRILQLNNLVSLDLSENLISNLPAELGDMNNLSILNLSNNRLHKTRPHSWHWLNGKSIRKKLRELDLSSNQLTELPDRIGNLHNLTTLRVTCNKLTHLPQSLSNLRVLRNLLIQENDIQRLPGGMRSLKLEKINISRNQFAAESGGVIDDITTPSLREIGGRCVLKNRIPYDARTIPKTLCEWLDSAKYCSCGGASMESYLYMIRWLDICTMAACATYTDSSLVPVDYFFCTRKCARRYAH